MKKIKSKINLVSFRIILNNLFFSFYGITRHAMHVMASCLRDLSDHWLLFLEQKETSLLLTDVIKVFQCQKKKSFHESNYTLVVVFRLNFLKNSQKVNKNTEKANSSIMVDELLLVINPEYSVGSNLTFSAADLYLENNNINHNIVYIRVLHYQSIT